MTVTVRRQGKVAIVTIDNPPVNALSEAVRRGLLDALKATQSDDTVSAVVLTGAGKTFVAGADVREFDKPPAPPLLPELLTAIEAASKPWVAALNGLAFGGGLELALVCRHRIAAKGAMLGLPEVKLGLIPGAGGTVRLPRLVDAETALTMVATGKPLSATQALAAGLLDAISGEDLIAEAVAMADEAAALPLRLALRDRPAVGPSVQDVYATAASKIIKKAGQLKAPAAAAAALDNALAMTADEALQAERALFLSLRADPQAKAMRYIFFAERAAGKATRIKKVAPRPLRSTGVVGGGTMGAGIAAAMLLAGYPVTMVERDEAAVAAGRERVEKTLDGSLQRGLITPTRHRELLAGFASTTQYTALADADLVVEAVFEDMAVKQAVFASLDEVLRRDAILASNTSYLDVNALAASTAVPERVVGLHFFSPAHIMKLLEIVVPEPIADEVLATAKAFANTLGKTAVLAGVCDGFIANRIMSAYRREADYLIEDGALPWEVDQAMVAFGMPMGVFQMQDLAGLDIAWAMRKRQAATRDPSQRYVEIADRLCEQGLFGRKSGRGWYDYSEQASGAPSAETEALIEAESARKGIARRAISGDDAMARILAVMQREGEQVLAEGIAASADDIDVVMVNAFGFPRWRGGPMFMASQLPV